MRIYLKPEQDALGNVFQVTPEKDAEFDEILLDLFSGLKFSLEGGQEEIRIIQDDILIRLDEESVRCTSLQELALLFFKAGISMCSMQYMIQAIRAGLRDIKEQKDMFGRENLN